MSSGIRMTGLISNMDTEAIVNKLMEAQKTKVTKVKNKQTKLEWKTEKWKDFNTKLYALYRDKTSDMRLSSAYSTKKATSGDEKIVKVTADTNATPGTHKIAIKQLASSQYVTSAKITREGFGKSTKLWDLNDTAFRDNTVITVKNGDKTVELTVDDNTTVNDFINKCNEAGLKASYDKNQQRFFINSADSGEEHSFTITTNKADDNPLQYLGLGEIDAVTDDKLAANEDDFTLIAAKDCKAIYNGVEISSKNNTISANGLTIEAISVSNKVGLEYEETSISVTNDVDAVYKKVKDFLTSYNAILKELNEAYNADSSRGYEPLTDEQKEAMTDDQIKKWEDKIKKSLLRRDDTVGSLTTAMKNALQSVVEVDGKKYSLATFGIMTSKDYTEKGLLHIYGDKDDPTYSDQNDKLKKAIEADPEAFGQAFAGIVKNLHDVLFKKMSKTSMSSALTFYNDKAMKDQIDDYKDDIKTMEKKLTKMENKYYKQFSAMETALAKLQEQQSALSGLLGGN